ncbi:MAG: hypothetical protein WC205_05245 [Opitutaceae bacterium]|jgi:hypothetical protein
MFIKNNHLMPALFTAGLILSCLPLASASSAAATDHVPEERVRLSTKRSQKETQNMALRNNTDLPETSRNRYVGSAFTAPSSFVLGGIVLGVTSVDRGFAGAVLSVSIVELTNSDTPPFNTAISLGKELQRDTRIAMPPELRAGGFLVLGISPMQLKAGRSYAFILNIEAASARRSINLNLADDTRRGFGVMSNDGGRTFFAVGAPLEFHLLSVAPR